MLTGRRPSEQQENGGREPEALQCEGGRDMGQSLRVGAQQPLLCSLLVGRVMVRGGACSQGQAPVLQRQLNLTSLPKVLGLGGFQTYSIKSGISSVY